jgi:CBS domain-containing protein/sporulation protein YlmC with PRC-barrel domain
MTMAKNVIVEDIYASRLLGKSVTDNRGVRMGVLTDILVDGSQQLPDVKAIVCTAPGIRREVVIAWERVLVWVREYVTLDGGAKEIAPVSFIPDDWVRVRKQLLDKQIVDIHGRKVVRINDVKLAAVGGSLRIVAADVGFRGILRRLGLRWLVHVWDKKFPAVPDELIKWEDVQQIELSKSQVKLTVPYAKLATLHPADLADIIEDLNRKDRARVLESLDAETAAEAFSEVKPEIQRDIIERMEEEKAADVLEEMDPDDAADVLGDLKEEHAEELLSKMEAEEAEDVRELLKYHEESAGGLMSTEFLAFREHQTCEAVITQLRQMQPDPELVANLYVVDHDGKLKGVVRLPSIVLSDPKARLSEIMDETLMYAPRDAHQDEIAEIMTKYDLAFLPVVDEDGVLIGTIDFNDVMDAVYVEKQKPKPAGEGR